MRKVAGSIRRKIEVFLRYMSDPKAKHYFLLGQIGNWFDMPSKKTVSGKGEHQGCLLTAGNMHNRFTVILCCMADADKLYHPHPFVCSRRRRSRRRKSFHLKWVNEKGLFNDETARMVLSRVAQTSGCMAEAPHHAQPGLLLRHITNQVRKAVADSGCGLVIIPGGLTPILQLLDL